jgi:hypothetical protein
MSTNGTKIHTKFMKLQLTYNKERNIYIAKISILDILSIHHTIQYTNILTGMVDGTYLAICLYIKL